MLLLNFGFPPSSLGLHHCQYVAFRDRFPTLVLLCATVRAPGGALLEELPGPAAVPGPDASARELKRALRSADGLILAMKGLMRLHKWEERDYQRWLREQRKGRPGRPPEWLRG